MNQEFQSYQMDLSAKFRSIGNFERKTFSKLNLEFERLREIMRTIIHKALKSTIGWFLNMNVMDFSSLQKTDELYELLSQEVSRLQELYTCLN
ncbi:hypothetical protein Glove_87g130 [Diversispora epigaea]|uniref:Uncharacterized protein n=1 Tax=Diversispora epigaea TaxID=1348612 RepID=A0A397JA01_9GLOM|nr:hypothetical protein Glove_87g130 [Diversispora epigaea]